MDHESVSWWRYFDRHWDRLDVQRMGTSILGWSRLLELEFLAPLLIIYQASSDSSSALTIIPLHVYLVHLLKSSSPMILDDEMQREIE